MSSIPVSAVVVTKNEAANIGRCLDALANFGEIVVVDSASNDGTTRIAREKNARVFPFFWDGRYPKKRQWALDNIDFSYDWIFFVDADEVVTPKLAKEIARLFWKSPPERAGYFVKGRYVLNGRALRFGLKNNKLALIDRRYIEFPVVNDLDIPGMGEIEGHYQPVLKAEAAGKKIGKLSRSLLHYASEDMTKWQDRHKRYALWQAEMDLRNAWPGEVTGFRKFLKKLFRSLPATPHIAFLHSYILKLGFLDGKEGRELAAMRSHYYSLVKNYDYSGIC